MTRIVAIGGYPGSGKTHLATTVYVPQGYTLLDDHEPYYQVLQHDRLKTALKRRGRVVFCDSWFVSPGARKKFKGLIEHHGLDPDKDITWVFFEADPDKALANIVRRTGKPPWILTTSIPAFTKSWNLPEGAEPLPIWQPGLEIPL